MTTALLFNRRPIPTGILGLEFDTAPQETHSLSFSVTDNPVEDGAPISDHIDPIPATLSLEGIITNAPIGVDAGEALPGRAERWFQELEALLAQQITFTVVTGLKVYPNMAVTSVSIPRDTLDQVRASISFKQIRLADSRTVSIPADIVGAVEAPGDEPGTAADQAQSSVDSGTVQATESTPEQAETGGALARFLL